MGLFQPTARYVIEAIRDYCAPTSSDVFYDLGSGDGRFVAAMAQARDLEEGVVVLERVVAVVVAKRALGPPEDRRDLPD